MFTSVNRLLRGPLRRRPEGGGAVATTTTNSSNAMIHRSLNSLCRTKLITKSKQPQITPVQRRGLGNASAAAAAAKLEPKQPLSSATANPSSVQPRVYNKVNGAAAHAAAANGAATANAANAAAARVGAAVLHVSENPAFSPADRALRHTNTVLLSGTDLAAKREEIRRYFHATFDVYERLFDVLATEKAYTMRADRLRHPLIFYLGHTACFYINKLRVAKVITERVNERFESLFAVGVDEMSWDDLLPDGHDWPAVSQVQEYRRQVRAVVDQAITDVPLHKLPIGWNDPMYGLMMCIEHERIHLETSSVLIRQLPLSVLHTPQSAKTPQQKAAVAFWNRYAANPNSGAASLSTFETTPANELVPVINCPVDITLGKPMDHDLYGWDNEYGTQRSVGVAPFKASKYLVTNREFFDFVADGGYAKREYWTDEGWKWAQFRAAGGNGAGGGGGAVVHPKFWIPPTNNSNSNSNNNSNSQQKDSITITSGNTNRATLQQKQSSQSGATATAFNGNGVPSTPAGWRFRTMLEEIDMPWDWPAETNYLEAKAWCNWKSAKLAACGGGHVRLPQEDEYQVMRNQLMYGGNSAGPTQPPTATNGGTREYDHPYWARAPGNVNLEYVCSSTPVHAFKPQTPTGLHDVVGNVWQHTETPIDAFTGFRVHDWYDDFSVPTFDLAHNLLKGGSWISTGNEATHYGRYAFRRHFMQHAGFRYIQTDRPVHLRSDVYEQDAMVDMYVGFHYGPEPLGIPNFPKAVADHALSFARAQKIPMNRALDVGCAVGRTVFELAREFTHVTGLDFSARFIRKGVHLKESGTAKFELVEEGELSTQHSVTLDQLGIDSSKSLASRTIEFYQADACNLDPRYTNYNLITAINLIDRLYDPSLFLNMIHTRLASGGLLVLSSPYTWLADYTPKEKWLGGYRDPKTNQPVYTLDGIRRLLSANFTQVGGPLPVPFVIRETKRKFQRTDSELTVWRKRS